MVCLDVYFLGNSCLFRVFSFTEVSIKRGGFVGDLDSIGSGDSWLSCEGFPIWKEGSDVIYSF